MPSFTRCTMKAIEWINRTSFSPADSRPFGVGAAIVFVFAALLFLIPINQANAQTLEAHTLYLIKSQDGGIFDNSPIDVYTISNNQITFESVFSIDSRATGPVGLGVDAVNEHLYVCHEGSGEMDVYNGRSPYNLLSQIPVAGMSDLAGVDTMDGRRLAFFVERGDATIFVVNMDTFTLVDQWILPNGHCNYTEEGDDDLDDDTGDDDTGDDDTGDDDTEEPVIMGPGAYDVAALENLDGRDVLFVASAEREVCWFDVDTHEEVGGITANMQITALAVNAYSGAPVIYGTATDSGAAGGHGYLVQHFTDTGGGSTVELGSDGRGIDAAYDGSAVFVAVSGAFFLSETVRVYDTSNMQEIDRANLSGCSIGGCSVTDLEVTWLSLGARIEKEITSHTGDINSGEEVVFTITITNTSSRAMTRLPVHDEYDRTHLQYISSTPASNNNLNDGRIEWADLTASYGQNLAPGDSYTIEAHYTADPDPCDERVEGTNVVHVRGARVESGGTIPDSSGMVGYVIICGCSDDEDCSDGTFCNGVEQCVDRDCVPGDDPCADDELWCNGDESCNEILSQCNHSGDPCADDGEFCNGDESCDERADSCMSSGDPCEDDGEFCNGDESCDEDEGACVHSGNPCPDGEPCDEANDECKTFEEDDDIDDDTGSEITPNIPKDDEEDDAGWPEGKVTGGCCGCG
jgi:DNA-binding beta-propeller fold protein YncE